ncbi:MAG: hypothetical protein KY466_02440 [Gemmatimonadetes bacterium]|nr:hypothetical protein [Gemmatimonadota bacterium]
MKRVLTSVLALGMLASPAAAQEDLLSTCSGIQTEYFIAGAESPFRPGQADDIDRQVRFLCGQGVSALTSVQPTIGIGFTGGNHVLGTATTIGRRLGLFPRISVTARANGALAEVPNLLDGFNAELDQNGQLPPMENNTVPLGSLQGDVQLGLFNGLGFGPVGGLGSIDLLGSVSFIPSLAETGLADPILNWGAGARVGILRQGLIMPGLSVSGMYRSMGEVSFGSVDGGDPAEFATDLSTISLRGAVSKGLLAFDFAAGGGYDIYRSDPRFDFELVCPPSECGGVQMTVRPSEAITGELQTAAWNVFANAGLSLLLVNVIGELGYQKGTEVITAEDLQAAGLPDQPPTVEGLAGGRLFGSIGVRFTL